MIISIKIKDKVYYSGKITTFLSKEILKIQKESMELAKLEYEIKKKLENMTGENFEAVDESINIVARTMDLVDKKVWLICEVYENKFKPADLENSYSNIEIDLELQKITNAIRGIVSKN